MVRRTFWSPREPASEEGGSCSGGRRGGFGKGPWTGDSRQRRDLELQPGLGDGPEGRGLPVGLLRLLPHDHVEAAAVLVAEEEARVVVIGHRVHVEGAFEVHPVEGRVSWGDGVKVRGSRATGDPSCSGGGRDACCMWGLLAPHPVPVRFLCLEMTEIGLGVPYVPTARPGSLFMV